MKGYIVRLVAASFLPLSSLAATWTGVVPCPSSTQTYYVASVADASALTVAVNCTGGSFAVEWIGAIAPETTIAVPEGTVLNVSGFAGSVVDGSVERRLFHVDGGVLNLFQMNISNGKADGTAEGANNTCGGAILADRSQITATSCNLSDNAAMTAGGAVCLLHGSTMVVEDSRFDDNIAYDNATSAGGAVWAGDASELRLEGRTSLFRRNTAFQSGAVNLWTESILIVSGDAIFEHNYATYQGAVGCCFGSELRIDGNCAFLDNTAYIGGALSILLGSSVTVTGHVDFEGNLAQQGGGISLESDAHLHLQGSASFLRNIGEYAGGVVSMTRNSTVTAEGVASFKDNYSPGGGGFALLETSSLHLGGRISFVNNTADYGGAVLVQDSDLYIEGELSFVNNSASLNGAAIMCQSGATSYIAGFVNFTGNTAVTGGAVYMSGMLQGASITGARFVSNSAKTGGAIAMYSVGVDSDFGQLVGSVFIDNTAEESGGALLFAGGFINVTSCDFMGNRAGLVGGAALATGTFLASNCEISGNQAATGPAIFNSATVHLAAIDFADNTLLCGDGEFLQEFNASAFETSCASCGSWDACQNCTVDTPESAQLCTDVLTHTSSPEAEGTLASLTLDEGYWRTSTTSTEILPCYNSDACNGGVEVYCEEGYLGPCKKSDCAVCQEGYSPGLLYTCNACSSNAESTALALAIIVAIVALGVGFVGWRYLTSGEVAHSQDETHRCGETTLSGIRKGFPFQGAKIMIAAWQILTQFASVASITYPALYEQFLNVVNIFNVDLAWIVSPGCFVNVTFHHRLLMITLGPVMLLVFLAFTYAVAKRRSSRELEALTTTQQRHTSVVLLVTFLVYSTVSSTVFQAFACDSLDDGSEYLRADHRIECSSSGHRTFQVYSGFMILLYPVGIPVFYAVILRRKRDGLLRSDRENNSKLLPFSDLWKPYRPGRYYYEVIECLRRVVLTGVVVFIFPNTAAQIASTFLLALLFAFVSESLDPYEKWQDAWLSRIAHMIVLLSMFLALLLKVDVSNEADRSQVIFSGVLISTNCVMVVVLVAEFVASMAGARCLSSCWSRFEPRGARLKTVGVSGFTDDQEGDMEVNVNYGVFAVVNEANSQREH